jgi:sarcosine oxidase
LSVDRRTFLKTAGAGAGAVLAGAGELSASSIGERAPAVQQGSPDVVVVGAGAFGGWTALYLRQMGANVTLIDAYGPGNVRATSGDEQRGIRTAYGDREQWTRWASEAITRWKGFDDEWGREFGIRLFFPSGDLILRAEEEPFLQQTRATWDKAGVKYEVLTPDEVAYRWPVIGLDDVTIALFEPDAGVARARRSCEAVAAVFQRLGGQLIVERARPALRIGDRLHDIVLANHEVLTAQQFVFACGPWLGKMFPEILGKKMRTPLGYVCYFGTPIGDDRFTWPHLPSYNFPGVTGWPALPDDNRGFRVRGGGGGGGARNPETDPDLSSRYIPAGSIERPRQFLASRFPALQNAPIVQTHACHYESSSSRNFIVDRHPAMHNVWIAGGGNAEGFKQGPVIGEYIAKRVLGTQDDPEFDAQFKIPEEEYEEPTPQDRRRTSG